LLQLGLALAWQQLLCSHVCSTGGAGLKILVLHGEMLPAGASDRVHRPGSTGCHLTTCSFSCC
jgi:hypothetical protein